MRVDRTRVAPTLAASRPPPPPPGATLRAVRLIRPRRWRRERHNRWVVGASVALHLLLLLLLVRFAPKRQPEQSPTPADVAMVFETAKSTGMPNAQAPAREASAPAPSARSRPPPPRPAPARPAPPTTAPPVPAPPAPPQVAPPQVAPPQVVTPKPTPPEVRAPLGELALAPLPEPQLQPPPLLARPPIPRAPPRPALRAPAPRDSGFPQPMMQSWSLGAPDSQNTRRRSDIAMGPPSRESGDVKGANELGPDWLSELEAYVDEHKRYPEGALMNGDQGDSTVLVKVRSDGVVLLVEQEESAGSPFLDMALLALFRHARLPPFPPGTDKPDLTFQFTMHYILRS